MDGRGARSDHGRRQFRTAPVQGDGIVIDQRKRLRRPAAPVSLLRMSASHGVWPNAWVAPSALRKNVARTGHSASGPACAIVGMSGLSIGNLQGDSRKPTPIWSSKLLMSFDKSSRTPAVRMLANEQASQIPRGLIGQCNFLLIDLDKDHFV